MRRDRRRDNIVFVYFVCFLLSSQSCTKIEVNVPIREHWKALGD